MHLTYISRNDKQGVVATQVKTVKILFEFVANVVSENGIVQILKLLHGRIDNGDILHLITFRVLVKERNSAICAFSSRVLARAFFKL